MADGGGSSSDGICYWQGRLVRLRAMEPSDWEAYHAWNQDDEQARLLYSIPFPRSAEAMRRWAERTATQEPDGDNFRWVITDLSGAVAGDLTTHDSDRRHGHFSYGISVAREHRRKGYASEAILLVLRYYFLELRYHKATVHVYDFNKPSLALHTKLGFREEGRLREMIFTNGRYHDKIIYGMTAEEFKGHSPPN
jgi:RimJ/RimL family protein N-acetyltransferase